MSKQLLPVGRPARLPALALLMALVATLLFSCGEGSSSSISRVGNQNPAELAPGGEIVLRSTLQRAVPSEVVNIRFTGFDSNGAQIYGPELREKAPEIVLRDVPLTVVLLRIEYISNSDVIGVFLVKVALSPAQYVQFSDPDFSDVGNVVALRIDPPNAVVATGATQQLRAIATLSDGTTQDVTTLVVWRSSDSNIATISNDPGTQGLARGLVPGTINPTASLTADLSASSTLTVQGSALTRLLVTPPNVVVPVGFNVQYSALALFSDGSTQDVTNQSVWSTSAPGVATIATNTGVLTSVSPGVTGVSATFSGLSGTVNATVTQANLNSLTAQPLNNLPVGQTRALRATGVFSDGLVGEVGPLCNWTIADPGIAVNNGDQALGIAIGATTATATLRGLSSTAPVTVIDGGGGGEGEGEGRYLAPEADE